MLVVVQGPLEEVYRAALSLGVANQLTNILRDVGEDANERDRCMAKLQHHKASAHCKLHYCIPCCAALMLGNDC